MSLRFVGLVGVVSALAVTGCGDTDKSGTETSPVATPPASTDSQSPAAATAEAPARKPGKTNERVRFSADYAISGGSIAGTFSDFLGESGELSGTSHQPVFFINLHGKDGVAKLKLTVTARSLKVIPGTWTATGGTGIYSNLTGKGKAVGKTEFSGGSSEIKLKFEGKISY